jgi:3',5'-cyclic AMP phosphodiesterase CpdA
LALGLWVSPASAGTNFWFVQISDTHFGVSDHDARTARAVEQINALPMPVDFVIHTGDFFSDNIRDSNVVHAATSTLARLRVPLYTLPGNHDILRSDLTNTVHLYTNAIGPLRSRLEHKGVVFLFLDTEPLRKGHRIEGYDPLGWLRDELRAAGSRPVIVSHHAPAGDDFYNNAMHPGWPSEAHADWIAVVNSANVQAVLCGHFHRDELYWEGSVPVYVCSSVAGFWGRQGSFRIYEYRDGKLGYRTRYLE